MREPCIFFYFIKIDKITFTIIIIVVVCVFRFAIETTGRQLNISLRPCRALVYFSTLVVRSVFSFVIIRFIYMACICMLCTLYS